ncbi:MAG: hypothetical protein EBU46_08955 [Nitrosomonadaceae bacterium]|nr:hypothetical protein [Nitrosomonadaceae bacterium]
MNQQLTTEKSRLIVSLWLPIFLTTLLLVAGIHEFKHRDELMLRYQDQQQLSSLLLIQTEEQRKYIAILEVLLKHYKEEAEKNPGHWVGLSN